MSLAITNKDYTVFGNKRVAMFDMAFDTSYPNGGETLTPNTVGLEEVFQATINNMGGYTLEYDIVNEKFKLFAPAPLVVFEEVVAMTDGTTYDTGTTKYPMAWPLYASNGNQALGLMPKGMNPVTTTVEINMHADEPGTRATLTSLHATDDYATITISYITQAWTEVFDNLVEGETMAAGATNSAGTTFTVGTPDVITLTHALCGIMVGLDLNGTMSCPKPVIKGETAVAGEYALDLTLTTATASASPVTTENWNAATSTVYFNYIKLPSSGFIYDRFTEEDASAASGQVYTAAASSTVIQPLLWSTPGFMVSVTDNGTTSATWPIGATTMTVGSTEQWQPTNYFMANRLATAFTATSGTGVLVTLAVKPSYVHGLPEDIQQTKWLEVPNGTDLSGLTGVKVMMIGR